MNKNLLKAILILAVTCVLLEGFLRQYFSKNYLKPESDFLIQENLKRQGYFFKTHFCNAVHQTAEGEELTAKLVAFQLRQALSQPNFDSQRIWISGSSSSRGYNCGTSTSWPMELAKIETRAIIKNRSYDGFTPKQNYNELLEMFHHGYFPNILIWSNSAMLEAEAPLPLDISFLQEAYLNLMANDLYMRTEFYLYRFVREAFQNFFTHLTTRGSPYSLKNLAYERLVAKTIQSQNEYLRSLATFANESHFKVVCIRMPNVEKVFPESEYITQSEYDDHFKSLGENLEIVCHQLGLPFIDLQMMYAQLSQDKE